MKYLLNFTLAVLLIVSSFMVNAFRGILFNEKNYERNIQQTISIKKEKALRYVNEYKTADYEALESLTTRLKKDGIILLHYKDDSLIYWSTNKIPVEEKYDSALYGSSVLKLFNSYYLAWKAHEDGNLYLTFINIYNQYPHENEFLHSGFNHDFGLPEKTGLIINQDQGYKIHDERGTYLFSITIPDPDFGKTSSGTLATLLFFAGLIFLGQFILISLKRFPRKKLGYIVTITLVFIIVIRVLQLQLYHIFSNFRLFDPYIYASSVFAPSLGDLLLNSAIVFFMALLLNRFLHFNIGVKRSNLFKILILFFYLLIVLVFFLYAYYFNRSLIYDSDINFQPTKEGISVYPVFSIFIFGLNYLSVALVFFRLLQNVKNRIPFSSFVAVFLMVTALWFSGFYFSGIYRFDVISIVFFFIISLIAILHFYNLQKFSTYTLQVLIVLIFSVYILMFITSEGRKKEYEIKSSLVLSLNNQHDPIAEYLFDELAEGINNDTSLLRRIGEPIRDDEELNSLVRYLERKHFTGYWNEYYMQISLCGPQDNILVDESENRWMHCYSFFDTILAGTGYQLPDSSFYYIENLPGRISYLGVFPFKLKSSPYETTLYIEMDSKPYSAQLGYPELLLEEDIYENRLIAAYSYAKYYKGELVTQSGDFNYSLKASTFENTVSEIKNVNFEGYNHLVYTPDKDSIIVLSSPEIRFFDLLVSFSYIFLFYYISLLLIILVRNLIRSEFHFLPNLRSKIQFAIFSILIISMVLIAVSSVWLNIRNYRKNQENILHEKIQSILVELTQRFGYEDSLSANWRSRAYDNINQLLIRFSDVYFGDFNLYDLEGNLLATSRYEVFNLGLQGTRINPVAFNKLHIEERTQFIHRETIGKLSFQSAYALLENYNGKQLAYLNLPYFSKQQEFQASMSALIMTIINIYVILILITIVASVFISNQITRPLELLQNKFRHLKLGHKYEQINYKKRDEIGSLVEEYNKMVLQLERSVELLAQNERESAWREMAKQIAHEIKNPLTPMRLSVQYLRKIWKEKQEDFDKQLENVSSTLIEQIDNLSTIASQFSNFATMPEIKPQNIDIVDVTKKCVELFLGSDDYSITFNSSSDNLFLKSDREQLSRALINIIKNAIQSIPPDRKGIIEVRIEEGEEQAVISISDNGCGIPDEVKSKMFVPNFTTKSSGMGLGLAISKNITEQLKGSISFTTRINEGTIFRLKFHKKA